tara:strand:- start:114 stop:416 length:303 start_codon:yes stop_codon:yes gene_type:complete
MGVVSGELTAGDLMRQAPDTIDFYLRKGIDYIDNHLGEGYAKEHPELLAGFIQACTTDFHTGIQAKSFEDLDDTIMRVELELNELVGIAGEILRKDGEYE